MVKGVGISKHGNGKNWHRKGINSLVFFLLLWGQLLKGQHFPHLIWPFFLQYLSHQDEDLSRWHKARKSDIIWRHPFRPTMGEGHLESLTWSSTPFNFSTKPVRSKSSLRSSDQLIKSNLMNDVMPITDPWDDCIVAYMKTMSLATECRQIYPSHGLHGHYHLFNPTLTLKVSQNTHQKGHLKMICHRSVTFWL